MRRAVVTMDNWRGTETQKTLFLRFLATYGRADMPRGVILHGPPGNGKTSMVYAYGRGAGFRIVEYNASSDVTAETLKDIFGENTALGIEGEKRLILLDEADLMAGQGKLVSFIKKSRCPVVLTANYYWNLDCSIQDYCISITFPPPSEEDRLEYAISLMDELDIERDGEFIEKVAARTRCYRSVLLWMQSGIIGIEEADPPANFREVVERHLRGTEASDLEEGTLARWIAEGGGDHGVVRMLNRCAKLKIELANFSDLAESIRCGVRSDRFEEPPFRVRQKKEKGKTPRRLQVEKMKEEKIKSQKKKPRRGFLKKIPDEKQLSITEFHG